MTRSIFHDNRSDSTTLARQWHNTIEVIEHATSVLCHPPSWDTRMKRVPKISYTSGEPSLFYEDMAMTTVGPDIVEPVPQLLSQ